MFWSKWLKQTYLISHNAITENKDSEYDFFEVNMNPLIIYIIYSVEHERLYILRSMSLFCSLGLYLLD